MHLGAAARTGLEFRGAQARDTVRSFQDRHTHTHTHTDTWSHTHCTHKTHSHTPTEGVAVGTWLATFGAVILEVPRLCPGSLFSIWRYGAPLVTSGRVNSPEEVEGGASRPSDSPSPAFQMGTVAGQPGPRGTGGLVSSWPGPARAPPAPFH